MQAPQRVPEGERVGEATSAVTLLAPPGSCLQTDVGSRPHKLLIADEVDWEKPSREVCYYGSPG
jgi:hypothetical protein